MSGPGLPTGEVQVFRFFSGSYIETVNSEKNLPDYSKAKNLNITWSHSQDPKANPFRTFFGQRPTLPPADMPATTCLYYNPEAFANIRRAPTSTCRSGLLKALFQPPEHEHHPTQQRLGAVCQSAQSPHQHVDHFAVSSQERRGQRTLV